jgi:hypothetical protein
MSEETRELYVCDLPTIGLLITSEAPYTLSPYWERYGGGGGGWVGEGKNADAYSYKNCVCYTSSASYMG